MSLDILNVVIKWPKTPIILVIILTKKLLVGVMKNLISRSNLLKDLSGHTTTKKKLMVLLSKVLSFILMFMVGVLFVKLVSTLLWNKLLSEISVMLLLLVK
jgi:hypothetical protein